MRKNTLSYKCQQYAMFAGVSTVVFCAVVMIPFVYGLYLTMTSWDGISVSKPFVGFYNYAETFKDTAYWAAMGRTIFYSLVSVVLVNVVAFLLAYLVTSGVKGQNFFRAGFFIPNLIGGIVLGYIWKFVFNRAFVTLGEAIAGGKVPSLLSTPSGAMAFWNDYLLPSLVLGRKELYTIPVATQAFYGTFSSDLGLIMAALLLAMLPILLLYIFLQRYIVQGVTAGAVKG